MDYLSIFDENSNQKDETKEDLFPSFFDSPLEDANKKFFALTLSDKYSLDRLVVLNRISKKENIEVMKCWDPDNETIFIKKIFKKSYNFENFERELDTLKELKEKEIPGILNYEGFGENDDSYFIIMEAGVFEEEIKEDYDGEWDNHTSYDSYGLEERIKNKSPKKPKKGRI